MLGNSKLRRPTTCGRLGLNHERSGEASEIDIFVSSTSVITLDHMKKLKNNAFVRNTGHFDNETHA